MKDVSCLLIYMNDDQIAFELFFLIMKFVKSLDQIYFKIYTIVILFKHKLNLNQRTKL